MAGGWHPSLGWGCRVSPARLAVAGCLFAGRCGLEIPCFNASTEDESLDLADFEKSCLAEALFLGYLAGG